MCIFILFAYVSETCDLDDSIAACFSDMNMDRDWEELSFATSKVFSNNFPVNSRIVTGNYPFFLQI